MWAAAAALLCGATSPAAAADAAPAHPVRLLWSTYLRAGPGDAYEAVTELEHDTRVFLAGCAGRWCRVSDRAVWGYIARDALELPRPPPPSAAAGRDCAVVAQADDHGRVATRFCPTPSVGR